MRGQRHHQRKVEVQIPAPALLALRQQPVEDAEQLKNAFLTAAVTRRWMLNSEGINAAIVSTNLKAAVTDADTPNQIHVG